MPAMSGVDLVTHDVAQCGLSDGATVVSSTQLAEGRTKAVVTMAGEWLRLFSRVSTIALLEISRIGLGPNRRRLAFPIFRVGFVRAV